MISPRSVLFSTENKIQVEIRSRGQQEYFRGREQCGLRPWGGKDLCI